jgi:ribosome-binding factor A
MKHSVGRSKVARAVVKTSRRSPDRAGEKRVQTKQLKFHHSVYVVLLDDTVAKHPSILRVNPRRDSSKACVYVGMTGLPVGERFENHKNGYKSAWVVKKYGVRLMPELYEH